MCKQSLSGNSVFASGIALFMAMSFMLTIGGCSSTPPKHKAYSASKSSAFGKQGHQNRNQKHLAKHFKNWRGTPYKLGGISKRGIDCSGFVRITFRDVFTKQVPRSTEQLAKIGKKVSQNKLRLGDLVFFKTGILQRHVGIYIGKGKFMHASTSRGVMLSAMRSPYWSKRYWQAKRVL